MDKKILAIAVATAAVASPALALDVYDNNGSTFSVGGHVSVNINGSSEGDLAVGSNSPRINFNFTQDLGNGYTADAKGEWALNMLDGGSNSFDTRLGYIGLTNDAMGRFVLGTQWAPYYDVAGVTDKPIAYATDFLYSNHGATGTGRADKMLSYRKGFDFGGSMLSLGLAWQGATGDPTLLKYDDRFQVTLAYDISDFMIGYALSSGDIIEAGVTDGGMSHAVSAKYGNFGDGLYAAAVYTMNEKVYGYRTPNDYDAYDESIAYEVLLAYGLGNGWNFIWNLENLTEDVNDKTTAINETAIQVEYFVTPNFATYAGYQVDLGDDESVDDDKYLIGARYFL
ncbi:porin [Vibrio ulleungensis]|uniref:Porin n=1 Tax=Vibrio ulleungensis TaxID=2807619 RepID=A0ABS2HM10_9VIBR|nr:porin [Vibrio ulleungensis]MBM7037094.1 porin [Vibrio ulleungensis]